jgi:hypothetical protein
MPAMDANKAFYQFRRRAAGVRGGAISLTGKLV